MPWMQLKARIAPEQAETLEELLLAEGATAITLQDAYDDPVFEPERGTTPLWDETVLTGLYDDLEGTEAMLERVRQAWAAEFPDEPCPEVEVELLADRDWEREWMADFHPCAWASGCGSCRAGTRRPSPAPSIFTWTPGSPSAPAPTPPRRSAWRGWTAWQWTASWPT